MSESNTIPSVVGSCQEVVASLEKDPRIARLLNSMSSRPKIECRPCVSDGIEGKARAFLTTSEITLCQNRLHGKDVVSEALVHELVHAYDYDHKRSDFSTCEGLAFSEVRAAREAECNANFPIQWLRDNCIYHHAGRSTANLYPSAGYECVRKIFTEAMEDTSPFS